jgi:hypothetical protein
MKKRKEMGRRKKRKGGGERNFKKGVHGQEFNFDKRRVEEKKEGRIRLEIHLCD